MVLTKDVVENMRVDPFDDFQLPDHDKPATVQLWSDELCTSFGRWLGLKPFDANFDDEPEYPDSWMEIYAAVDPKEEVVSRIYMKFVVNSPDYDGADELGFLLDKREGHELYEHLVGVSEERYTSFLRECKEMLKEGCV